MNDKTNTNSSEEVLVRLRISARDKPMRALWLEKLLKNGCKVQSTGRFGIEAYMDPTSIRNLLGKKIVSSDGEIVLEDDPSATGGDNCEVTNVDNNAQSTASNDIPYAYVPRKRELY